MHPVIIALAQRFGARIVERCASDSQVFDGESIASYYRINNYDDNYDQVIGTELRWMTDHDLLHEIGHWIAAPTEQRDLPEFGLFPLLYEKGCDYSRLPPTGVVDSDEGTVQEFFAEMFSVIVGKYYNLSIELSNANDNKWLLEHCHTWDSYLCDKINRAIFDGNEKEFWIAMIRFNDFLRSAPCQFLRSLES
jgi:hypothetical protein